MNKYAGGVSSFAKHNDDPDSEFPKEEMEISTWEAGTEIVLVNVCTWHKKSPVRDVRGKNENA